MRFYVISLLAVALLFAPISARRIRRQAEPETTTESGSETSTDFNNSGTEASGEESGVETSGAETSGAEGSGLESSGNGNNSGAEASGEESGAETSGAETSGAEGSGLESSGNETSGELSGEEPIEGQVPVLTLTTLQASALSLQTQADVIALQTQSINNQMNTLTQEVQKLGDAAKQLNSQVSDAIIQAGSSPTNQTLTGDNSTCSLDMACFADSECNGGTCTGAFVGTCNCNACFQFTACTDDSQCGGFKTACNNVTHTCDCFQAYTNNGLSFFDAQISLCNTQKCTTDNTDACFGLPCNAGRCAC